MTTKNRTRVAISGVLLVALCGAALLWFFAFPDDLCANDNLRESISPKRTLKAVVFRRNCGATTGFSTQVSILSLSRKLPDDGGNIFIVEGEPEVVVRWVDDRQLNVFLRGSAEVFQQLFEFNGVQVNYL